MYVVSPSVSMPCQAVANPQLRQPVIWRVVRLQTSLPFHGRCSRGESKWGKGRIQHCYIRETFKFFSSTEDAVFTLRGSDGFSLGGSISRVDHRQLSHATRFRPIRYVAKVYTSGVSREVTVSITSIE